MPLDTTASQSNPFIKLGDPSKAPTLDYNLPQEVTYNVESYAVIPIPNDTFDDTTKAAPIKNIWSEAAALPIEQITSKLRDELITGQSQMLIGAEVVKNAPAAVEVLPQVEVLTPAADTTSGEALARASITTTDPELLAKSIIQVDQKPLAKAPEADVLVAGVPLDYVAGQIKKGLLPRVYKRFSGALAMQFVPEPEAPQPTLMLVEHYRISAYLGNYGAGKVVQTFSLLPGERTQITIKSFKNQSGSESTTASSQQTTSTDTLTSSQSSTQANSSDTSVKNKSDNFLDSFSKASANELEELVGSEVGISNYEDKVDATFSGTTTSETIVPKVTTKGTGIKINMGAIGLGSGFSQTSGGTTNTTDTTNGSSSNVARGKAINALESAIKKSVARSSQNRDVQINTTTGSTNTSAKSNAESSITGTTTGSSSGTVLTTGAARENALAVTDENLSLRELQNINLSRTLNFVFRQMQQEYVTVMYLEDISLVYTNGYPDSEEHVRLPDVDKLLNRVLKTEQARLEVRDNIRRHAANVYDYRGQRVSFGELFTEEQVDLGGGTPRQTTYLRKRADLGTRAVGEGNSEDTYGTITVPGIILSVQSHILRTDSVLVDTVLGQGEALDYYNASLQQLAIERATAENERLDTEIDRTKAESEQLRDDIQHATWKRQQAESIIALISDPMQKAEAYQKMFAEYSLQDIMDLLQS